jgi:hypothetical protein
MTTEEAYLQFSQWYENCLNSGIEPNDAIEKMGGMFLLTDEKLIDQLKDEGVI